MGAAIIQFPASSAPSLTVYEFSLQKGAVGSAIATVASKQLQGAVRFDPSVLTATGSLVKRVFFEAILETSNATNLAYVDLYDIAAGAVVAGSELSTSALVPTFMSVELSALAALGAPKIYQARLWMAPQTPLEVVTSLNASLVVRLL
jgi:hypothetical protein